jgi:hypothetical protein
MEELKRIYINAPEKNTPAWLDVDNRAVMVNIPYFEKLPSLYQKFIIAHEEGHFYIPTLNEMEADFYAFKKIAGTEPGSLQATINTLANVLPFTTPEHAQRLINMYCNAMLYNYIQTNDEKYLTEIHNIMNYYGFNVFEPLTIAETVEEAINSPEPPQYDYILLEQLKSAAFDPTADLKGEPFGTSPTDVINETTTSGPPTSSQNPAVHPVLPEEQHNSPAETITQTVIKTINDKRAAIMFALLIILVAIIIIK